MCDIDSENGYLIKQEMKLYIKNMVCNRCKEIVKGELDRLGIDYLKVGLGEVITRKNISSSQRKQFAVGLRHSGFELIEPGKNSIIEKLKRAIIDLENYSDEDLKTNYSDYISLNVSDNFISLNKLFSEIEGVTIEKFIIKHKIELVKELLLFKDMSLTEIAIKMHYSSTAQLSSQFKSMTGLTPIHFRELQHNSIGNPMYN